MWPGLPLAVAGEPARALPLQSRKYPVAGKLSSGHAGPGPASNQEAVCIGADDDLLAIMDLSREDHFGQRILHVLLDYPLQGPRPIGWIVALGREPRAGLRPEFEGDLAVIEEFRKPRELNIDNRTHVLAAQPVEQDDFVDAVQKLWPEMRPHNLHDFRVNGRGILAFLLQHE